MKRLIWLLFLAPPVLYAQDKGIHFEQELSWTEVQAKAKAEHKYIFADCYGTWCGPCKVMDEKIYSLGIVGDYLNDKFISVRVQMDSSSRDNEHVKSWYGVAHALRQLYNINKLPDFLFFSPDGNIVHEDFGYKGSNDFIRLAADASDPAKQYYTLLENYRRGIKNPVATAYLAIASVRLGYRKLSDSISQDYVHNYLDKLTIDSILTTSNINFMVNTIRSSKERSFYLFYKYSKKINDIMNDEHFSENVVDNIIITEDINSKLWTGHRPKIKNPDWDKIRASISKKYNDSYAVRTVLNAKIMWFGHKNQWPELIKYNIEKIERYGLDTSSALQKLYINNMIFEVIFKYSRRKDQLMKAAKWMETILRSDSSDEAQIDTYANVLYKMGQKEKAIQWEEKALKSSSGADHELYQATLDKMQKGERTWEQPLKNSLN